MTVYRRGNNWSYDFRFRHVRYRGSFGPVSKLTAETQERKLRVELAEDVFRPPPAPAIPTFQDFCLRFLRWYEPQHRRASIRATNYALDLACRTLGPTPVDAITAEVLTTYQTTLLRRGLTKSSVNSYLKPVRHLLRVAGQWGVIPAHAVPKVTMIRHEKPHRRVLSLEEEDALLDAMPQRLKPLVQFALYTGLRHTELTTLRWSDLDFKAGVVRLTAERSKSARSREVPLNTTARDALTQATIGRPDGLVFGYKAPRSSFARARARAGLDPSIKLHSCRHTFATRALEAGVDLPTVQAWLGHASILMTAEYTHPSPSHGQRSIRLLDRMDTDVPTAEAERRP